MKKIYSILFIVVSFICFVIAFISILSNHHDMNIQGYVSVIMMLLVSLLGFIVGLINLRSYYKQKNIKSRIDRDIIRANMQTMREYCKNHIE